MTTDGTNLYVPLVSGITQIDIATGAVTSLTGTGITSYATYATHTWAITSDGAHLFVLDNSLSTTNTIKNSIRRLQ
jgi:hypothetical protein